MSHEIHRVTAFEQTGQFALNVRFEDGTIQAIDFKPVLAGELFGPLFDPNFFARVAIDPEAATLVWPNGADFDPNTLYNWPEEGPALARLAQNWLQVAS